MKEGHENIEALKKEFGVEEIKSKDSFENIETKDSKELNSKFDEFINSFKNKLKESDLKKKILEHDTKGVEIIVNELNKYLQLFSPELYSEKFSETESGDIYFHDDDELNLGRYRDRTGIWTRPIAVLENLPSIYEKIIEKPELKKYIENNLRYKKIGEALRDTNLRHRVSDEVIKTVEGMDSL